MRRLPAPAPRSREPRRADETGGTPSRTPRRTTTPTGERPHPGGAYPDPSMTTSSRADSRPLRLALVDDYEVVLRGVAHMFEQYRDQVEVVEIDAEQPVSSDVDIALYD